MDTIETTTRRPALTIAALASAGAGLVHAAAAGTHQGDQTLVVLFSIVALAQLGWALLVLVTPGRWLAVAGGALNLAAVGAWALSRTTGLPVIDSLREQEAVGRQDLVAAALATMAVLGCAAALLWPRPTRAIAPPAIAVLGVLALAGAYVGVVAPHAHGAGSHAQAHGETEAEADGETAAGAAHVHDDSAKNEGSSDAPAPGHEHHEVPERLDHEPTAAQVEEAEQLIEETKRELVAYANVDDAIAAGYKSIGDGRVSGVEHFINAEYTADQVVLDPTQPESLVYRLEPNGTKTLTTAMYIMPAGSTMDDVPDIAGNLTVWHAHDNLCFAPGTNRLAGALVNGQCRPGGESRPTPPMLHVWIIENACGPFAGTDARQMTGSCTQDI